jgi:hypothetical protein
MSKQHIFNEHCEPLHECPEEIAFGGSMSHSKVYERYPKLRSLLSRMGFKHIGGVHRCGLGE